VLWGVARRAWRRRCRASSPREGAWGIVTWPLLVILTGEGKNLLETIFLSLGRLTPASVLPGPNRQRLIRLRAAGGVWLAISTVGLGKPADGWTEHQGELSRQAPNE
jgi:hypothetical protein